VDAVLDLGQDVRRPPKEPLPAAWQRNGDLL
jgi:hypothetical protein